MPQVRELVWKVVDHEALILDIETGDYFSLSPVATDMWERLQAGQGVPGIVAAIASRYGADGETVASDVTELVEQLREARLLR